MVGEGVSAHPQKRAVGEKSVGVDMGEWTEGREEGRGEERKKEGGGEAVRQWWEVR